MTKSISVFLDALRLLAALLVFATHANIIWFDEKQVAIPGRDGVVVFFVLSGYVIAFTATRKKGLSAKDYVVARLSRLYSVVVPALIFTAFLLFLEWLWDRAYYTSMTRSGDWFRFLTTSVYMQSVWYRNLVPPTNGAFWSLGYEFWYYVMFGFAVFARGWKWKVGGVLACCLIVGENVLLLLPIWIVGAAVYFYRDRFAILPRVASAAFCMSLVAIALITIYLADCPIKAGHAPYFYSASYISDNTLGLAVGFMIWFYGRATWAASSVPAGLEKFIRWGAGHTFSLYLFHYPLIYFAAMFKFFNPHVWWQTGIVTCLILAVIVGLGELTELKRKYLQQAMAGWWDKLAGIFGTKPRVAV